MAGSQKISQLPNAGVLSGTELVPLVQGGTTKNCTTLQIATLFGSGGAMSTAGTLLQGTNSFPIYTATPTLGVAGTTIGSLSLAAASGGVATLLGDSANTLGLQNGTIGQALRIYGTFTNSSNYERLEFDVSTNSGVTIQHVAAGTGTGRTLTINGGFGIQFQNGGGSVFRLDGNTSNLLWNTDNTNDIGTSGANRPRNGFFAASLQVGASPAILTGPAAAQLQLGAADAPSPVAQTLSVQNVVAGTSNTAGQNWTFNASRGTGIGIGGSFIFQGAIPGGSGTSQNALSEIVELSYSTASGAFGLLAPTNNNNGVVIYPNGIVGGLNTTLSFSSGGLASGNWSVGDTVLSRGAAGIFKFASAGSFSANGSVATALTSVGPTGSHTTVQTWLTIVDSGGTTRYIPCF